MLVDDIALTLYPGVGSRTAIHLIACFGSAERLFAATADEIVERAELRPDLAQRISRREYHERAAKEVDSIRRNGIRAIDSLSPDYPQRLRECSDYPHVLYVSGDIDLNRGRWLTVVGTRDCTAYGAGVCERIIREVARPVSRYRGGERIGFRDRHCGAQGCHAGRTRYGRGRRASAGSHLSERTYAGCPPHGARRRRRGDRVLQRV